MQLQPVSSFLTANPWQSSPAFKNPLQTLSDGSNSNLSTNTSATSQLNATVESEYLSKQTLDVEFTSKDGDKVSLSLESLQYQKTMLQVDASGSSQDMSNVLDYIKQQFKSMNDEIAKSFMESQGVDDSKSASSKTDKTQDASVPAYWNADNTSQRIVDFATQFLSAFKGSGDDFLTKIKDAINEGFKQAEGELGKLPDQVNSLVNDTHDLVMQKLDKWAESQGINVSQPETVGA